MQIESGIPIPVKPQWKADLDKLKVGQSAKISLKYYNSVKAAISMHYHRQTLKTFTTAKQSENQFRVWRVQ